MQAPKFWYPHKRGEVTTSAHLLAPAAALYDLGVSARRKFTTAQKSTVPIICVGNLTVGGTGKTPVVIALAEMLIAQGRKPYILTRGYGGKLAGPALVDVDHHDAADVGDEPLLLARAAPVIVCSNRPLGARFAISQGADIILMDDGFQNPTVHKGFSIVVVDGHRMIGNGKVFPAGPLRENARAGLARADAMLIMGAGSSTPLPPILAEYSGQILYADLVPQVEDGALKDRKIMAFAGIGAPSKFFRTVRKLGAEIVAEVSFPDHHPYTDKDVAQLKKRARDLGADLVTTEKDAVRFPKSAKGEASGFTTIPVKATFTTPAALEEVLEQALKEASMSVETVEIRVSEDKRQPKPLHYLEAALFYTMIGFFRLLGLKWASNFGGFVARTIGPRISGANRARRNLALAMPELEPEEVEKIIYEMFDNLGRTTAEYAHLAEFAKNGLKEHIELVGWEIVDRIRAEGGGAILVSGHFGNWELMPLALKTLGGKGAEIYRAPNNPFIDDWLIKQRATHIFPVQIPKGAEGGRALLKVVRAGEDVAMLVDQKMNDGIPVPFFGREAMTPPAAAALSLRYKVPIIPARMERIKGTKFRLTISEPPALPTTGDMSLDTYNLCVWLNEFLETAIRERPGQWLWLHQRWGKFKNGKLESRGGDSADDDGAAA